MKLFPPGDYLLPTDPPEELRTRLLKIEASWTPTLLHPSPLPQISHLTCLPSLPTTGILKEEKPPSDPLWNMRYLSTLSNVLISSPRSSCWRLLLGQECFWSKTKNNYIGGEQWKGKLMEQKEWIISLWRYPERKERCLNCRSNFALHGAALSGFNRDERCTFDFSHVSPILFVCFASTCASQTPWDVSLSLENS